MRTSIGNRWREVTKNHLIVVDCEYRQRYCPPRRGSTSPRRLKHRSSGFSAAARHNITYYVRKQYKYTTRRRRPPKIIVGTLRRDRRPYRSAFRQPMPLSDTDDNGASFEQRSASRRRRGCDRCSKPFLRRPALCCDG